MSEESGEDAPPRPKRRIKRVMVLSSSSGSDSDESVCGVVSRTKRLRVMSDDDVSDSSSGSSVAARRRRKLPQLRDSEMESDASASGSDHLDCGRAPGVSGFASDSSEGNSDKCSICLLRFTDQQIGTPENCEHIFCLDCITEWSKNVNTCPVDRATFKSIVVRACIGGRVLRTEPVTIVERPPSVEALVIEDPTPCEICRSTSHEEVMLLCDGCDLGYHMHCLTPALTEIPINQWFCPDCISIFNSMGVTDIDDGSIMNLERRLGAEGQGRYFIGILRNHNLGNQPSTSNGRRGTSTQAEGMPSTSRGSQSSHRTASSTSSMRRRTGGTHRRRPRRRQTRTVVIEYEVEENGKFPVTKRVKRRIKRRKTKKRPRTAARRSHVRASVHAKLASQRAEARVTATGPESMVPLGLQELTVRRQRAGIPSLNLFGDHNQLDFFSDDENDVSEGATTAVAARPTSNIIEAYRQARRKLITIASPPHATSAPDILSNILESQTLLHSKDSIMTISVDGNVNIKLRNSKRNQLKKSDSKGNNKKDEVLNRKKEERVDINKVEDASKKAPSYPGQSRGGGWGGGYRGNYHRDQTSNDFNRTGNYDNYSGGNAGNGGGGYQSRQGQGPPYGYQNNNIRREEPESFGGYTRRPHQYSQNDDAYDRTRRPVDNNRGPNYPNLSNLPRMNEQNQGRYSLGPSWQPYASGTSNSRTDILPPQARHSFGGFENPLDMRMGQAPSLISNSNAVDMYSGVQAPRQEKPLPQGYPPLPEPPTFNFDKIGELDKSEDERSDSGLVIDTEKYDPTEPTNDDDSGDEDKMAAVPRTSEPPPALPQPTLPHDSPPHMAVQNILAGIDTSTMNVPHNILDSAVRQVLQEHRNLIVPTRVGSHQDKSDEESDGDCPNFSIYSATSVHIANNSSSLAEEISKPIPEDNLEDLVQEDDETPPPEVASPNDSISTDNNCQTYEEKREVIFNKPLSDIKKKTEEEYKEKISKRCPITTNTRNPIKIKLNTPSLMKRSVTLYDDDDVNDEVEITEKSDPPNQEDKSIPQTPSPVTEDNNVVRKEEKIDTPEREELEHQPIDDLEKSVNEKCSSEQIIAKDTSDINDLQISKEQILNDTVEAKACENKEAKEISDVEVNDTSVIDKDDEASETDEKPEDEEHSDVENDNLSENELEIKSPEKDNDDGKDNIEKMTESISETEDERSYTPCLDENKSKDTSFETDKEKGIQGLDTEMISEDEGNEMFSENERPPSPVPQVSPPRPVADGEEGEIVDKKVKEESKKVAREEVKKKKKKDSKKEGKDKGKSKKKGDVAFKKLSKNGKERNYRERDKDEKKSKKERRESGDSAEERQRRRREKRKDLARYDVRSVVTEKRKKTKDPFGRDISPRARSPSLSRSPPPLSRSGTPPRPVRSPLRRRSLSRGPPSPFPRSRLSPSPRSATPLASPRRSASPKRRTPVKKRRRSATPRRRASPRRRRSASRGRKRRRSASRSPKAKPAKKKKRARSERPSSRRRQKSPKRRRRLASRSPRPSPRPSPPRAEWTPPSVDSRLLSPRTPPPEPSPERRPPPEEERRERRRRDPERRKRGRDAPGPSKEVFASGDNILVSVSFEEREREEGERRRRREGKRARKRRRAPPPAEAAAKPVAIIDLDRSPFRELTPSPENVIVLSDSDRGEPDALPPPEPAPEPAPEHPPVGPKTPPEPARAEPPPEPPVPEPRSPDAYDPFEPTRSASASPASPASPAPAPSPPRALMTLEAAQKTNMSADEVLDRRPLSPMEKVLALLQSTRDVSPEPPPEPGPEPPPAPAPAPRIVLPSPTRSQPKLFPGKPSPIKSNPVKPMQQARRADEGDSPYSPGSSDFGDLFEPPAKPPAKLSAFDALFDKPRRKGKSAAAKVPVKLNKKKGKTQVGVKIDEDNLKILDDLPSSAVEMQVKSKFLKKLNRQERVVEEVKLVLKPHYNKKHVTKDEYKDILRRAVPKICHNKTGEINPTKIQALVEAYVKKFRKKHKLGLA